jgi:hypothetical protein
MKNTEILLIIVGVVAGIFLTYFVSQVSNISEDINEMDEDRKYVSRDVKKCELADFLCRDGMRYFIDESGCGCEVYEEKGCQRDAKICPDGSTVGRDLNNDCDFFPCPTGEGKTYCTPESREGEFCIEVYQPVCGWFDSEKIVCVKHPCAKTFSNSCFACLSDEVEYWTVGVCPQG